MTVGILDFFGPAQFITANGLLGAPFFFSCLPLCLITSLITAQRLTSFPAGQQDMSCLSPLTVLSLSWLSAASTEFSGSSSLIVGVD